LATKKIQKFQGSKSEFIRTRPAAEPAATVVEAAKAVGLSLTPGLVYNVRHAMRTPEPSAPVTTAPPAPAGMVKVPSGQPVVTFSSEDLSSSLRRVMALTSVEADQALTSLESEVTGGRMSIPGALARAFLLGAEFIKGK
jgi:hypothetical protein